MDKEVAAIGLVIITILTVYVIVQPIIPTNNQKFSEIGILGPQRSIANYPTLLTPANNSFTLYGYIGNHKGTVEFYRYVTKIGNASTFVSNTTSANAPILITYSYVLDDGQNITFPIHLTISETGLRLKLIFELWDYNSTIASFVYTGLWNQLWINATTS
jgi:uncharacterized membrane protein